MLLSVGIGIAQGVVVICVILRRLSANVIAMLLHWQAMCLPATSAR